MSDERFNREAANWDKEQKHIERTQAVAEAMRRHLPEQALSALEFGAGTGLLGFSLLDKWRDITFLDSASEMLKQVDNKIGAQKLSNAKTLLATGETVAIGEQYDCIFSAMTLHHIPDTEQALRSFTQALKPDGYLLLADLDQEDGSFHGENKVPHNGFERKKLQALAEKAGLRQITLDSVFVNRKEVDGQIREYPMFLLVGRR